MKKVLKFTAYGLAGIVALLLIAYFAMSIKTGNHINQKYSVQPANVFIPADSASVARGQHIVESRGCTDCHGADLGGKIFIDDPALGRVVAANLTGGKGGVQALNTDEDWVRAIRHGVHHSGRPLLVMPSNEYYYLSDEDLGSVIAYLKQLPPVDNELPEHSLGPLAKVLYPLGKLDALISAEMIDHTAHRPAVPVADVTAEYGEYLAVGCQGCHYPNLEGGPSSVPGFPPAPNLTRTGNLVRWTEADFIQALRTGKTVDGRELNNNNMPWQNFGKMNDTELRAIWLYLQTLPRSDKPLTSKS